ncbi:ASCH domain-containing protein [Agrobacterium cavarae]|uniref:ASCH domain-containing protein n=1 Tax=Agrobacterium cavarae TaxID=2528239 RepID=UPI0028A2116F|nr:ASCH domain-containing protein [Agrobacterium cavarae]
MKVLLSIKPEYAEKIFNGEKSFEFRKTIFTDPDVDTVVVYATMPVGKVIGEFKIADVHEGEPEDIWRKTEKKSGISSSFFSEYFLGRKRAYAIEVGETKIFDVPKTVMEILGRSTPPQSFAYLK